MSPQCPHLVEVKDSGEQGLKKEGKGRGLRTHGNWRSLWAGHLTTTLFIVLILDLLCVNLVKMELGFPESSSLHHSGLALSTAAILCEIRKVYLKQQTHSLLAWRAGAKQRYWWQRYSISSGGLSFSPGVPAQHGEVTQVANGRSWIPAFRVWLTR